MTEARSVPDLCQCGHDKSRHMTDGALFGGPACGDCEMQDDVMDWDHPFVPASPALHEPPAWRSVEPMALPNRKWWGLIAKENETAWCHTAADRVWADLARGSHRTRDLAMRCSEREAAIRNSPRAGAEPTVYSPHEDGEARWAAAQRVAVDDHPKDCACTPDHLANAFLLGMVEGEERRAAALPPLSLGHEDEIMEAFVAYDRLVRWEEHNSRLDATEPIVERAYARGRIIAMVANFAADALSTAPALPVEGDDSDIESAEALAVRILDDGGHISATVWIEARDAAVRADERLVTEARIAELGALAARTVDYFEMDADGYLKKWALADGSPRGSLIEAWRAASTPQQGGLEQ